MIAGTYAASVGEAPARSSLVPRDLTAELCLIALASLGHVPYGVLYWSLLGGVICLVFCSCV